MKESSESEGCSNCYDCCGSSLQSAGPCQTDSSSYSSSRPINRDRYGRSFSDKPDDDSHAFHHYSTSTYTDHRLKDLSESGSQASDVGLYDIDIDDGNPYFFSLCPLRDKYAKPYEAPVDDTGFKLYCTYPDPGLISIFFSEEGESYRNWALAISSGQNRGQIRYAIDRQICAKTLEILGNHDGSVYMACPPNPISTLDVEMPCVTILMRNLTDYASVEFTVLDVLGFSRKIHAKNFKTSCTIGELNCEIPMRLSPTWNYACVNLEETLLNAFGTHLKCIQRIKINANCRVRRVYFHNEVLPYKSLPEAFRIKLNLSPKEKKETEIYEQFRSNEPLDVQHPPWALPKLLHPPTKGRPLSVGKNHHDRLPKNVIVNECPKAELEPEKYHLKNPIKSSNPDYLRHLLKESFPASRMLLSPLNLIYPDKESPVKSETVNVRELKKVEIDDGEGTKQKCGDREDKRENLVKLKKCFERQNVAGKMSMAISKVASETLGEYEGEGAVAPFDPASITDWDLINQEDEHPTDGEVNQHILGCKYKTSDLAQYIKHRQVLGEYDLFAGTPRHPTFLEDGQVEEEEEERIDLINSDELLSPKNENQNEVEEEGEEATTQETIQELDHSHHEEMPVPVTPLVKNDVSNYILHNPSAVQLHSKDNETNVPPETTESESMTVSVAESWVMTWAYAGLTWKQTREVNQKLLDDALKQHVTNKNPPTTSSLVDKKNKKPLQDSPSQKLPTQAESKVQERMLFKQQQQKNRVPESFRTAIPRMPKVMKSWLKGTSGYYDLIFDNPTLPIDYY